MKRPTKLKAVMDVVAGLVQAGRLTYSSHANQRLWQRKVTKPEVEHVLTSGHHEARKDQFSEAFDSWDYAIRGKTVDGRLLRIVVAIDDPSILVVTVIDLDRED